MSARILVIDDDATFVESVKDLFEACGYTVFTASGGSEGVKTARDVLPDLIVLDVMMASDTEGFDVARQLHDIQGLRNTGVILVTGVVDALKLPKPLESDSDWLPVDRILDKPIDPERLLHEVGRVLKAKHSADSAENERK